MPANESTIGPIETEPVVAPVPAAELDSEPLIDAGEPLVEADLLIEDVSIDGLCGVY